MFVCLLIQKQKHPSMKSREFKDAVYEGLAKLLKALANPARLEIIEMLSQGETMGDVTPVPLSRHPNKVWTPLPA